MVSVGIRALQQNASEVVRRAAAGETIDITDRGRLVARMVPISSGSIADLLASGQAVPAKRRLADVVAEYPPLKGDSPPLSEIVDEMRADRI